MYFRRWISKLLKILLGWRPVPIHSPCAIPYFTQQDSFYLWLDIGTISGTLKFFFLKPWAKVENVVYKISQKF